MNWLVNVRWAAAVAAAAFALLGIYMWDVRDNTPLAGVLWFVALLLIWQWFRIGGWLARLERARRESE